MDFLQGIWRAPWSFVRTTDHRFAIKVWGEESRFLDWRVTPELYRGFFPRLRAMGFAHLDQLRAFMAELAAAVDVHGDTTEPVVAHMKAAAAAAPFDISEDWLIAGYRAWMEDVHEFCVVESHPLDADIVGFDRQVRAFRQARPWLRDNLGPEDRFDYRYPTAGSVLFHGVRHSPEGGRLLFVANMEGAPATVVPNEIAPGNWQLAVAAPGTPTGSPDTPMTLPDGTGLIFVEG